MLSLNLEKNHLLMGCYIRNVNGDLVTLHMIEPLLFILIMIHSLLQLNMLTMIRCTHMAVIDVL